MRFATNARFVSTLVLGAGLLAGSASAQTILFNLDNAPIHTSLPVDVTASGVTAHLTATSQGMSIQSANVLGFTPVGFSGLCIYPNSVFPSDLKVSFSTSLKSFSILYAPQELDCDSSCTMRVTAYMDAAFVATNTATTSPGVWPTGTLAISTTNPFNNVVVHYDSPPPTGGDWGPIFLADNMTVKTSPSAAWSNYGAGWAGKNGIPALTMTAAPVLCGSTTIQLGNSSGVAAPAMLFMGATQVDLATGFSGHLLVTPTLSFAVMVPAGGLAMPTAIPCDGMFNGVTVYLQALEADAAASDGVSFTRGLTVVLGS